MDKHLKITLPAKTLLEAVEFGLNAEIFKHPCKVVGVDFVKGDKIDNDDDQGIRCVWEIVIEDAGVKVEGTCEPVEESGVKIKPVNHITINSAVDLDMFEQQVRVAVTRVLKEIECRQKRAFANGP